MQGMAIYKAFYVPRLSRAASVRKLDGIKDSVQCCHLPAVDVFIFEIRFHLCKMDSTWTM